MSSPGLMPVLAWLVAASRVPPIRPLKMWWRHAGQRLRPPLPRPYAPSERRAEEAILASGRAEPAQRATILHESRRGDRPTIVLGGFVPDATEQVYLLRGFLLRQGSVFYLNYPRERFSLELLLAQLDDLVSDLATKHGTPPVIFAVSFGAGIVLEWLKHHRRAGGPPELRGLVLVSPVGCLDDVVARNPASGRGATLLGRALQPYLEGPAGAGTAVERSRALFGRMFEAGAQNRAALTGLLSRDELERLRHAVMKTIREITATGAQERLAALRGFEAPSSYFSQALLPLACVPTLILFAEREDAVLTPHAPTRFALESAPRAYFPAGEAVQVRNRRGAPVQHASLIFHCFNFLPPISRFYRRLKTGKPARIA